MMSAGMTRELIRDWLTFGHGVLGNLRRRPWLALFVPALLASFVRETTGPNSEEGSAAVWSGERGWRRTFVTDGQSQNLRVKYDALDTLQFSLESPDYFKSQVLKRSMTAA